MKDIFHIKKHKQILFLFVGISILFSSCIREDIISDYGNYSRDGYMKIYLNTPDVRTPYHGQRAMGTHAERTIDQNLLSILVFKCDDDTETFYYQAPISGSIIYEEGNKAVVTVKLAKSASDNDLYKIIIVANHDISGINMIKDVTTKTEILEQLTYSVSGKWNADTDNYSLFPMWGETMPMLISENTYSPTINLYRALARIDVGLNFGISDGKLTEHAFGIGNFQLKEINVYRTYNKGHVAPLNGNFTTTPSIPFDATRNGATYSLNYTIENATGADSFVREIYVPEADLPNSPTNDNVHCIVVGGYYNNSSVVSYYRLDFATETALGARNYLPILRNHRYAFNIIQVRGAGATSAQKALETYGTIESIDYDLIVWDETIHEMEIRGKYYFGLDNRDLLFEAQSTINDTSNFFTIKYQTNYPLSVSDSLQLIWTSTLNNPSSTSLFNAQWQASSKSIRITAETDNTTKNLLSDTLLVYAGPFMMKVAVQQKYIETIIIPHMNILVLAYPDEFGYSISDGLSGASKIFNSPNNFGSNDSSIIKVEGFSFISSSTFIFESFDTENLRKWVTGVGNGGKIADIVYLANYAEFDNPTTVGLLVDYMDKGGVVVVFNEEPSIRYLINAVLNVNNISSNSYGDGGAVYPFPANPYFISQGGNLQDILSQFENDPILNGPFGDVRDKQWGEDINASMTLSNIAQSPNLTIYSRQVDIAVNNPIANINSVNGLKYESEDRNIIWFGDGGFMSSFHGAVGNYNTACPLNWNPVTFFPEPKSGYGSPNQISVYNSIVFCNTMAWAINKSESLRAKRKTFEDAD